MSDKTIVHYVGMNMRVNSGDFSKEALALGQIKKCFFCKEDTVVAKSSFRNVSAACLASGRTCRVLCDQCGPRIKFDVMLEAPGDPKERAALDKLRKEEFQRKQRANVERMRTLARQGKIPPDVHEVAMYHDDDCPILSQRGPL